MSERDTIEKVKLPCTRQTLAEELRQAGVMPGKILLVHSSLSALGWVCGGPVAVIQALMDVLTPQGTLVMPTHSGDYSDPAEWHFPSVPEHWHQIIRDSMPVFDPHLTPTRGMGAIPELFRSWPDVRRSNHPMTSFAAWGRDAEQITAGHELDYPLGDRSPLARIYDLDGWVLLLGVGYNRNTSFHLAEYRVPGAQQITQGAPVWVDGRRVWKSYRDIETDDDSFPEIGVAFEEADHVKVTQVQQAEARLFSQRTAVDFARRWLGERVVE